MTNIEPSMPNQDASMPSGFSIPNRTDSMTNLMSSMPS